VLDLCCNSAGFALNAKAAGAREVVAVDLDEEVLAIAEGNARMNKMPVRFVRADIFRGSGTPRSTASNSTP
jgi:23S rRNA (cytosine1962-C5)-methyltransferase